MFVSDIAVKSVRRIQVFGSRCLPHIVRVCIAFYAGVKNVSYMTVRTNGDVHSGPWSML